MLTLTEAYTKQSDLNNKLNALRDDLDEMKHDPQSFFDLEGQFDDMLDDTNDCVTVAGVEFLPSQVLKECDPTAYRCTFSDFCSDYDVSQYQEYIDLEEEIEALEYDLEEIEEEIEELESEE